MELTYSVNVSISKDFGPKYGIYFAQSCILLKSFFYGYQAFAIPGRLTQFEFIDPGHHCIYRSWSKFPFGGPCTQNYHFLVLKPKLVRALQSLLICAQQYTKLIYQSNSLHREKAS